MRTCLKGCHFQRLPLSKVIEHLQHCLREHLRQALGKRTERMPKSFCRSIASVSNCDAPVDEKRRVDLANSACTCSSLLPQNSRGISERPFKTSCQFFRPVFFSSKYLVCQVERAPTSSCIEDTCWEQQASQQALKNVMAARLERAACDNKSAKRMLRRREWRGVELALALLSRMTAAESSHHLKACVQSPFQGWVAIYFE